MVRVHLNPSVTRSTEMLRKADWLLLLFGDQPIEPIRIQKGMFLFAKESGATREQVYEFVPYNWGPCSFEIYNDLDELLERGFIEQVPVPGARWHKYLRTPMGKASAEETRASADPSCIKAQNDIRDTVTGTSFDELLRHVYKKYPEYATKSVFRT